MKTDELAFELSRLVMQRKQYLFRKLNDAEKSEFKRLNRQIKTKKNQLSKRQLRLEGF